MDLYFLVNYLTEARSLNRNFLCRKTPQTLLNGPAGLQS